MISCKTCTFLTRLENAIKGPVLERTVTMLQASYIHPARYVCKTPVKCLHNNNISSKKGLFSCTLWNLARNVQLLNCFHWDMEKLAFHLQNILTSDYKGCLLICYFIWVIVRH